MIESKELDRILSLQKEESLLYLLDTEKKCVYEYNSALWLIHNEYDEMKNHSLMNDKKNQVLYEHYESEMIRYMHQLEKADSELKEIRNKIKAFIMNA